MRLSSSKNMYHYDGGDWTDADFYIKLGEETEIIVNPTPFIEARFLYDIGLIKNPTPAHNLYDLYDLPINKKTPLGTFSFFDYFIVFKNTEIGRRIYDLYTKDITLLVINENLKLGQEIGLYPEGMIKQHVNIAEMPMLIGDK
jgi:hypothetical protein